MQATYENNTMPACGVPTSKRKMYSVRMPEHWIPLLRAHAEERGTDVSNEMRIAISQYMTLEGITK